MKSSLKMLKNDKQGLSTVVATVVMIALTIAATVIVWTFVNKILKEETESASSCFQFLTGDKVVINSEYTCYDSSTSQIHFSIGIGEIDVDEVLVSISGEDKTKSFKLSNNGLTESYLKNFGDVEFGTPVYLPKKNAGLTYIVDMASAGISVPASIKIAPIVNGKQCEVSDSLNEIDACTF